MSKKKKKITGRQIVNSICIVILSLTLTTGVIGFSVLQDILNNSKLVSGIDGLEASNSTRIFDRNGKLITTLSGKSGVRENVSFEKIPQCVIDAFLAVEDSRFYQHNGFDLPRFMKSALNNLKSGGLNQGGSTLTMQLVDAALFQYGGDKEQTASSRISQKVQEIFKSMEIEGKLDKNKIMENYLNQINFGGSARGIQKGANYYFGKDVKDVNLSEAAFLAGVINAPELFNPYNATKNQKSNFYKNAVERRNKVLYLMHYHGYITDKEYKLALSTELAFQLNGETNFSTTDYKAFVDYAVHEVKEKTGDNPYTTPMDIYTTMDKDAQKLSDDMSNGVGVVYPDERFQTGFTAMNNQTGEILALGAGRSYDGDRNRAYVDTHQPGSIAKPLVDYIPAFEYLGYSTGHTMNDKQYKYNGDKYIYNYDKKFRGLVSFKYAVGHSLNTTAFKACEDVISKIGIDKEVEFLNNMGIKGITKDNWTYSMSIGGGDFNTTPLEMAGAYSTLANKGEYIQPYAVRKIKYQDSSRKDYENQKISKQVYSEESAYLMSVLLKDVVEGNYGSLAEKLKDKYTVYAKTGTTSYEEEAKKYGYPVGIAKDKWMAAYTNKFTVTCWAGYDGPEVGKANYLDQQKLFANVEGSIINQLLDLLVKQDGNYNTSIPRPDGVVKINQVYNTYPYIISPYPSSNTVVGYINRKFLDNTEELETKDLKAPSSIDVTEEDNQQITVRIPEYPDKDMRNGSSGSSNINNPIDTMFKVIINGNTIGTYKIDDEELTIPINAKKGEEVEIVGYYQYRGTTETSDEIKKKIKIKNGLGESYTINSDFSYAFKDDYHKTKVELEKYLKNNYPEIYKNDQFIIKESSNSNIKSGQFDPNNSTIGVGSKITEGDEKYYIYIGE